MDESDFKNMAEEDLKELTDLCLSIKTEDDAFKIYDYLRNNYNNAKEYFKNLELKDIEENEESEEE